MNATSRFAILLAVGLLALCPAASAQLVTLGPVFDDSQPTSFLGRWTGPAYTRERVTNNLVPAGQAVLVLNPDGSLDIAVGPAAPAENLANWIATTPGELFRLNMRVYLFKGRSK